MEKRETASRANPWTQHGKDAGGVRPLIASRPNSPLGSPGGALVWVSRRSALPGKAGVGLGHHSPPALADIFQQSQGGGLDQIEYLFETPGAAIIGIRHLANAVIRGEVHE